MQIMGLGTCIMGWFDEKGAKNYYILREPLKIHQSNF